MGELKKALITGINGQDGSYLAELLLSKGYEVGGIYRRSSSPNLSRIEKIKSKLTLFEGDITDYSFIQNVWAAWQPHEIYNLAAQSHVKTSFVNPIYTANVNYIGVLNWLELLAFIAQFKQRPFQPKLYQASTSEMFGDAYTPIVSGREDNGAWIWSNIQNEATKFNPQSPYSIAKLAAHHACRLYREAHGVQVSCGILFNHETLTYNTPLIVKINNQIDILPIGDIARFKTGLIFNLDNKEYQYGKPINDIEVWDKNGWTKVKFVSGYPHIEQKNPRIINARNFVYAATGSHICFMADGSEKETSELNIGDKILNINYPEYNNTIDVSLEEAEFLGMMCGDGNLHGKNPRFTNKDISLKQRFIDLWYIIANNPSHKFKQSFSGFNQEPIGQVECYGEYDKLNDIYTEDISPFGHKNKKIPVQILNSSIDVMEAFLIGYNNCDGLKQNKCKYKFKNFKTNSSALAAGLLFLASKVTQQKYNITVEESWKWGRQQFYYSINLLSNKLSNLDKYYQVKEMLSTEVSQRFISKELGVSRTFIRKIQNGFVPSNTHHLELCSNEIKKIIEIPNYNGWFFDLETESGTFHAGIGQGLVHNSPRRGDEFVTKKITNYVKKLRSGIRDWMPPPVHSEYYGTEQWEQDNIALLAKECGNLPFLGKLKLGNLTAKRDWGYAPDYVEAMWLMLQQDKPDDYVISTGEAHTVEEFLVEAFSLIGVTDIFSFVEIDPSLKRPAEVEYLCGDSTKAREKLGWKPKVSFKELVKIMVEN